MSRILCAAMVSIAVFAFEQLHAEAHEAPWCAVINTGMDVHWDCQYQSFEQCYPNILAGNRGFCNQNPAYHGPERRAYPSRRHIRQHDIKQ